MIVGCGAFKWRGWASSALLSLIVAAVAVSFLPLFPSNAWWIRYADFPRLQFAIASILLLSLFLLTCPPSRAAIIAGCTLTAVPVGYHAYKLGPYTPFSEVSAPSVKGCGSENELSLMVANVKKRNQQAGPFLDLVSDVAPDLLLVLETDAWWDRRLATLGERFQDRVQYIPDGEGAFGMHVFSEYRLVSPEFRFLFGAHTPTAFTGIELPGGEIVQFLGLHPHPPLAWSQPTTLRDASILSAAIEARKSDTATILAGDFNAVPWESVSRRAVRIGGLLDPRIGRGFFPTFDTESIAVSWPLDQVLFEGKFGLVDFELLRDFGSDHFAVLARLCYVGSGSASRAPEPKPGDMKAAEASIEAAAAMNISR